MWGFFQIYMCASQDKNGNNLYGTRRVDLHIPALRKTLHFEKLGSIYVYHICSKVLP